jgi:hypothetical protein
LIGIAFSTLAKKHIRNAKFCISDMFKNRFKNTNYQTIASQGVSGFSKRLMGHDPTDIFSSTQGMGHFVSPSKKWPGLIFDGNALIPNVSSLGRSLKKTGVSEIQNFVFLTLLK